MKKIPAELPSEEDLRATDPPILLASLIASRRLGDELLQEVCERELTRHGIAILFLNNFAHELRKTVIGEEGDDAH
ncbi:MAG TPA: hypothetical protein VH575_12470 [Gemmataceae bacterium]|jgi:hypothetical protein